jgi:hypothetical protein
MKRPDFDHVQMSIFLDQACLSRMLWLYRWGSHIVHDTLVLLFRVMLSFDDGRLASLAELLALTVELMESGRKPGKGIPNLLLQLFDVFRVSDSGWIGWIGWIGWLGGLE